MLALFETLFDIIRLRKGPDAVPHSTVLLAIVIGLWLFAGLVVTITTPELDQTGFIFGIVAGIGGLGCYAAIILLFGRRARLLQAVIAIFGCGALLSLVSAAADVFLKPFLSANFTDTIVALIILWSVPVEGHIISRTIERHWYLGVVIAMAVFVLQLVLYRQMNPAAT